MGAPDPGKAETPLELTETLLGEFIAAARAPRFDERLFDISAGGNLTAKLEGVFAAVSEADVHSVVRGQRPLAALLGADAEARMAFALARQRAERAMTQAHDAAALTSRLIGLLEQALDTLTVELARLENLGRLGDSVIARCQPASTPEARELHARFTRQLANLQSLRAATALTIGRLPQAVARNRQILDRYNDLSTALFPVWERHSLSVLQSPAQAAALEHSVAEAARSIGAGLLDRAGSPA